jgi:hypothetical protein
MVTIMALLRVLFMCLTLAVFVPGLARAIVVNDSPVLYFETDQGQLPTSSYTVIGSSLLPFNETVTSSCTAGPDNIGINAACTAPVNGNVAGQPTDATFRPSCLLFLDPQAPQGSVFLWLQCPFIITAPSPQSDVWVGYRIVADNGTNPIAEACEVNVADDGNGHAVPQTCLEIGGSTSTTGPSCESLSDNVGTGNTKTYPFAEQACASPALGGDNGGCVVTADEVPSHSICADALVTPLPGGFCLTPTVTIDGIPETIPGGSPCISQ